LQIALGFLVLTGTHPFRQRLELAELGADAPNAVLLDCAPFKYAMALPPTVKEPPKLNWLFAAGKDPEFMSFPVAPELQDRFSVVAGESESKLATLNGDVSVSV